MIKMKKYIIGIIIVCILLVIGVSYIKVEVLTLLHGSEFLELYDISGWMNDITYLKVYSYSEREAVVYYADFEEAEESGGNAAFLYYFYKLDGEWKLEEWKCIWSESGNAQEWIWPYYGHP